MKRQAVTPHTSPLSQCPSLRYLYQLVSRYEHLPTTTVSAAPAPPSRPDAGVNGLVLFARSATQSKASPLSAQQKTFRHFLRQVKKQIGEVSGDRSPDFDALDVLIDSSRNGLPSVGQLKPPVQELRRFVKSLDSRADRHGSDADPASHPANEDDHLDDPHAIDDGTLPAGAVIERDVPIEPAPASPATDPPLTELFPPSELFQLPEHRGRRSNRALLVVIFLEQLARPTRHLSLVGVSAYTLDQSIKDGTFATFATLRQNVEPAIEKITLPSQMEACPPCLSHFPTLSTIRLPRPEMSTLDLTHLPSLRMVKLYAPLNDDLAAHTSRPAACHVQTIYED